MTLMADVTAFLKRVACWFDGHIFEVESDKWLRGGTDAPAPAVDEWFVTAECNQCGHTEDRFIGFLFENEARERGI